MITPKWARRRSTPIALENVLNHMIAAADLTFTGNQVLELAGPDVLTYQEIMEIDGEFIGRKPIVIPVLVLAPELSSYWLYFVSSVPPTTAMSLVEGSIACRDWNPRYWFFANKFCGEHETRAFDWLIGGPSFRTGRRVVEPCAYWHPAGFCKLSYWYPDLPLYNPRVQSAVAEVARRAEALDDEWHEQPYRIRLSTRVHNGPRCLRPETRRSRRRPRR